MGTKQFSNYSDLLTFTRASAGHALRPVSYGTELVSNGTFDTDSDWTLGSGWSINTTTGQLVASSTASNVNAIQNINTVVGKIYSITIDCLTLTAGNIRVYHREGGGGSFGDFVDFAAGQTAILTFVATTDTTAIYLYPTSISSGTFDNVSVKEVTFDESDGTLTLFEHPDNIPRVEWDSAGNRLGLLVEEARTNVFTYSEDFSNSAWTKFPAATVTPSLVTTPDGQQNGFLLEATGTNRLEETPSTTITGTATFSIFAKYDDVPYVQMTILDSSANGQRQWFKIQDGTLGSSAAVGTGKNLDGASITDMNNGFYRLSLSVDGFSSQTARCLIYLARTDSSFDAASGDSAVVYGAQLEQSSFPTSYIKTTGSTATRSADVASIPVADFGFNADEMTLFAEAEAIGSAATTVYLSDGTANERMFLYINDNYQGFIADGGSTQAQLDNGTTVSGFNKISMAVKKNSTALSLNGGSAVSDTSCTVPAVTTMNIGSTYNNSVPFSMHIKSIKYYPRRLTNAQLQDLTS